MQTAVAHPSHIPGGEQERVQVEHHGVPAPARIALVAGVAGILANVTYVLAAAVPVGESAESVLASLFGPLIAAQSLAWGAARGFDGAAFIVAGALIAGAAIIITVFVPRVRTVDDASNLPAGTAR